jgi:hypothetical protein
LLPPTSGLAPSIGLLRLGVVCALPLGAIHRRIFERRMKASLRFGRTCFELVKQRVLLVQACRSFRPVCSHVQKCLLMIYVPGALRPPHALAGECTIPLH